MKPDGIQDGTHAEKANAHSTEADAVRPFSSKKKCNTSPSRMQRNPIAPQQAIRRRPRSFFRMELVISITSLASMQAMVKVSNHRI
jgi:hypothetical protein